MTSRTPPPRPIAPLTAPTPKTASATVPAAATSDLVHGQADTAEAMALLKLIKDLSLRVWRDHLVTADQAFLFDMSDKFHNYGAGLYVSPRQLTRLRDIRIRLISAGVL